MSDQDENERQCLVCWLETWQCNTADFSEEDLPDVSGARHTYGNTTGTNHIQNCSKSWLTRITH